MFFDHCNDFALRLFDPDPPKLGNGFALLQLDEAHLGKALRQGEPRSPARGNPPR